MSGNDFTEISVDYVHHTDYALLVRDADDKRHWLPLSTVDTDSLGRDIDTLREGDPINIRVQEWIAEKNDLI